LFVRRRKMKMARLVLIVLISALILAGCGSNPKVDVTNSPLQKLAAESPLVPPESAETGDTSAPIQLTQVPLEPPTPAAGKGIVYGVLIRDLEGMEPEPMSKTRLYLAPVKEASGGGTYVSHSPTTDPVTFTNEDGSFVFTDLEPGTYGLIVATPLGSVLMKHQDTTEEVVVTVGASEAVDLGELHFMSPL
jgi:hypothetical protein